MTVKDDLLYVGSHGKTFSSPTTGKLIYRNMQWVKTITKEVSD